MNKYLKDTNEIQQKELLWNGSWMENWGLNKTELENGMFPKNLTFSEEENNYIFDQLCVRIPFIVVYSIVFCFCVFGNLIVILLVFLSRRLKSTTNFFLANLAFADLCVGIFCVFQNLAFYLITTCLLKQATGNSGIACGGGALLGNRFTRKNASGLIVRWIFGEFFCKMNQFIHSLSCTASIFILVVICVERYLAIIHPIRCKQILTRNRLRVIISFVWIVSTAYSMPRYLISHTISNSLSGSSEIICIMSRIRYNSKLFDIISFILLYLLPLAVMTILYSIIAVRLWNSGFNYPQLYKHKNNFYETEIHSEYSTTSFSVGKRSLIPKDHCRMTYNMQALAQCHHPPVSDVPPTLNSCCRSNRNVLRARRRVIRMLTILVLTFAVCNLPFHARKMWQYWSKNYDGTSTFSSVFTPITFLCTYCNSAINPLLYAFFSKNFQKSIKELLSCTHAKKSTARPLSFRRRSYSFTRACSVSTSR